MDFSYIFNNIFKIFTDNTQSKDTSKIKEKSKKNFALQLKEKLFMTPDEIKEVMNVVEAGEKTVEEFQKNYDFSDINLISTNDFGIELMKLQKQSIADIQAKVKEIMNKKLERAKKILGYDE